MGRQWKARFDDAREKKRKLRPKVKFERKIRAGLIEQEDGDVKAAPDRKGPDSRVKAAPDRKGPGSRVKAATRRKDKIHEKRRQWKARFDDARDKKRKLRPKVKFERKIRAGLIEQEDGDVKAAPDRKGP